MKLADKYRGIRGFSLTELSVSLAIIALIAGSALSVAFTSDFSNKVRETEAKLDRIEESLSGFLAINYRLPCPADGTLASTNANFGTETTPSNAGGNINGTRCASANFNDESVPGSVDVPTGNVYAGVVPVRTLQLPDDFMYDGWGKRVTYIVDNKFANSESTNADCDGTTSSICFVYSGASTGKIEVRDEAADTRITTAVYTLLSHGENGHGSYIKSGSSTRFQSFNAALTGTPFTDASSYADEVENAHFNSASSNTTYNDIFVQREYINFDNDPVAANRKYFDDIVRFKTKSQLVIETGEIIYDSICKDADDIIDNPVVNSCSGGASESNCTTFASELQSRCLQ